MSKIALGTAQFGLDYGINNQRGQVPKEEVFSILSAASEAGIDTLDTASSYGNSENIIGEFIKKSNKQFKIISKAGALNGSGIKPVVLSSLDKLGVDSFYGYLIHGFQHYLQAPEMWQGLSELKLAGKIKKIGLSIYTPEELEHILRREMDLDVVQVPYNIFDRRFEPYFPILKGKHIEIHVRSIFLQGIVFKNPEEIEDGIAMLKDKIRKISLLAEKEQLSRVSLCLNFVLLNQYIDKVILGVDGLDNFREIVRSLSDLAKVKAIAGRFADLCEDNIDKIYQYLIDVFRDKQSILTKGA